MPLWNPFKNRQPGAGKATAAPPGPSSQKGASPSKTQEALDLLRQHPNLSDTDLASALQLSKRAASSPIKQAKWLYAQEQAQAQASFQAGNGQPIPQAVRDAKDLTLVQYSPQELLLHVQSTRARVDFQMSQGTKFTSYFVDIWAVIGPMVLATGTSGEVFSFIWMHSKVQNFGVALAVLATVIVLEATFMVVSWANANIRHRAYRRVTGPTKEDKESMSRHKHMWFVLAAGIALSQGIFLATMMTGATTDEMIWLGVFAVFRPLATMASDYYTAFVHEEKPTTAQEALREQQEDEQLTIGLIRQKTHEMTVINEGTLDLQEAHSDAEIRQDSMETELEMRRMENKSRIDAKKAEQESREMVAYLTSNMMRAFFDPKMPLNEREVLLTLFSAMGSAMRELPTPQTHVQQEEEY